ncbi:hypothetical protein [Streptomyces sp. NBC_01022]|uniref:hypothetical protein n=1 Tax=Streptomyces sp. NBC_01022 TaxID=2903723 RepID=UPI002DD9DB56|nr:hypothetical protein [Streptomyces sp. NBC_01022]WRZ82827.1 hypothetical protein OG316_22460 [Streptomyces sp. NBC_01022]
MHGNGAQKDWDSFEGGLGSAMKQTGEGFSVAGRPLVDGGIARGRRRTVLRRSAAVSGSVAALAVIGLGGSYVTGGFGAAQHGGNGAAVGAQSTENAGTPEQQVFRTLANLLPEGHISEQPAGGAGGAGKQKRPPAASVVYDDGHGKAAMSVALSRQNPDSKLNDDEFSCPDKNLNVYEACSATTLKDGSRLVLFKGWEYPDRREDTKWWYADLLTPEGYRVSVSEWNAPAEKGAPVSRPAPPLSLDRMEALARAEEWRPILASVPEPAEQTPAQPAPRGLSGDVILGRLTEQLPDGLTVKASGKQESEYAYVVVDDGRGKSFVQINVQPDMSDVEGDLFGSDTKVLTDGTKVTTYQGPGEKGGKGVKTRQVDTMRPDGFRVVISAFNSANQSAAAGRKDPALTLAELQKIATSKVWRNN